MKHKISENQGFQIINLGLLFAIQNLHIHMSDITVNLTPDIIGNILLLIGFHSFKKYGDTIKKEINTLYFDIFVNVIFLIFSTYISLLFSKDIVPSSAVEIGYYSMLALKAFLACLIIRGTFTITRDICIKNNTSPEAYRNFKPIMIVYILSIIINSVMTIVTSVRTEFTILSDEVLFLPVTVVGVASVLVLREGETALKELSSE